MGEVRASIAHRSATMGRCCLWIELSHIHGFLLISIPEAARPTATVPIAPNIQERRGAMQHMPIKRIQRVLELAGVNRQRSPRWIAEANSGQVSRVDSARIGLNVK